MAELVTPVSGAETVTRYMWGLDLSQSLQEAGGIGGLLLQDTGTATRLYTYEANGNVGQLVDGTTGAVVAHYEYDPFGTTLTASGTDAAANPFRFSTKYTDDDTGLLYYGYRFYSPTLGRWLTRDPMEEDGGANLYGFVLNSPIDVMDVLGLFSFQGFADGIWDFITEPVLQLSDIGLLVMVQGYNNFSSGEINDADIQLSSGLGRQQHARINAGIGVEDAAGMAVNEMLLNSVTGGGVGMASNIFNNVRAYNAGEISLVELDYNLSRGAGGQFAAAATAVGVSYATGNGMTGRVSGNSFIDQFLVDEIIARRYAVGKKNVGAATFAKGHGPNGFTGVAESKAYSTSWRNYGHAEAQVLSQFGRKAGPRTVAVDQTPCTTCSARLFFQSFRGTTRAIRPVNPNKVTMNPKTAAMKAASGSLDNVNVGVHHGINLNKMNLGGANHTILQGQFEQVYYLKLFITCTNNNNE